MGGGGGDVYSIADTGMWTPIHLIRVEIVESFLCASFRALRVVSKGNVDDSHFTDHKGEEVAFERYQHMTIGR